jgi:hypothetical protein
MADVGTCHRAGHNLHQSLLQKQWELQPVACLLLLLLTVALCSGIWVRLTSLPYLWGRMLMPDAPFCSPGALVCQAEELGDILHIVCS